MEWKIVLHSSKKPKLFPFWEIKSFEKLLFIKWLKYRVVSVGPDMFDSKYGRGCVYKSKQNWIQLIIFEGKLKEFCTKKDF